MAPMSEVAKRNNATFEVLRRMENRAPPRPFIST
jgi:hypothetical protein